MALKHRVLGRLLSRFLPIAPAIIVVAIALSALTAPAAPQTPGAAAAPPSSDPRDARLIDFLQKRLKLSDTQDIKLGPLSPSAIAGLWSRSVGVSGPQGATLSLTIFMDSTSNKVNVV